MSDIREKMFNLLGGGFAFFMIVYFGAQVWAAFDGIEYHWGIVWAWIIIVSSLGFRFSLPITIGAFFGALDVWEFNWFWALVFAFPTLILLIPGLLMEMLNSVWGRFKSKA